MSTDTGLCHGGEDECGMLISPCPVSASSFSLCGQIACRTLCRQRSMLPRRGRWTRAADRPARASLRWPHGCPVCATAANTRSEAARSKGTLPSKTSQLDWSRGDIHPRGAGQGLRCVVLGGLRGGGGRIRRTRGVATVDDRIRGRASGAECDREPSPSGSSSERPREVYWVAAYA